MGTHPGAAQLLLERQTVLGHEPLEVRVVTLGQTRIEVDGQVLRLGLRRALEVVAFLLCRGAAKREREAEEEEEMPEPLDDLDMGDDDE